MLYYTFSDLILLEKCNKKNVKCDLKENNMETTVYSNKQPIRKVTCITNEHAFYCKVHALW